MSALGKLLTSQRHRVGPWSAKSSHRPAREETVVVLGARARLAGRSLIEFSGRTDRHRLWGSPETFISQVLVAREFPHLDTWRYAH